MDRFDDKDIYHLPFPYPWKVSSENLQDFFEDSIKSLLDQGLDPDTDLCGFMLETFQGWGAIFYPKTL